MSVAGAGAPLGATVTLAIDGTQSAATVQVPLGALDDEGEGPGVWILDGKSLWTTSPSRSAPSAVKRARSYNPKLSDPSFAKIITLTPSDAARDTLQARLRACITDGLAPEARVRVSQLVFGP